MTSRSFFERRADDAIRGASEALFPKNTIGAPDWEETELAARTIAYLALLPPAQGRLLTALFVVVELVLPILKLRPARFSRLSVDTRTAIVRRFRASRFYPFRLVGDSVKAVLTMIYMSHPKVLRHIGQYAACTSHAGDEIDVRLEALRPREKVA